MSLKVAIVGCGKIADGHIEEVQKMPELARVVAVCDLELLMAEQIAVRYGIASHYDDFERLLDAEKPDVVHIATPPGAHLSLATAAMDAGCHVYVEKPLTLELATTEQVLARAEQAGKKLTVGYTYLFDPPALAMRELIAAGVVGDVVHAESFYGYNLAGPFGAALLGDGSHWVHRLPGKLFHNTIDHMLNKLVEFFDDDQPRITAVGTIRRPERFGDVRDEMLDELRLVIQGETTTAYGTFSSHIRPAAHYCRVFGTRNSLHVDYVHRTVTLEASTKLPSAIGRLVPAFEQAWQFAREGLRNSLRFAESDYHYFAGLNTLLRRYYESIRDDGPVPIPYRDIRRIAAWMDDIFAQLGQGQGGSA